MLAFIVRNHQLAAVKKPVPALRLGWALVRVRLAGICKTDIEILHGYHNFRGTLGHEFTGEVAEVCGMARERARWIGRRVAGEINIGCAALGFRSVCKFCRRGWKAHCAQRRVLGIVAHDGAFAEYLTLPLENLHLVPDEISDEMAVFTEPLAAACEILEQVPARRFREAAVLGDGKLGQLIARVLCTAGLRVTMFGKHASKLAVARHAGICIVRGKARDFKRRSRRFALVVEATGSPRGLGFAQEITEPRGTLVVKSTFHGATPVETWPLVVKEIHVVGSRCGPFEKALKLLRSGEVDPRPLITRTFPLEEVPEAMRYAQRAGVMKVLLGA